MRRVANGLLRQPLRAVTWSSLALLGPLLLPLVTGRVFTRDDLAALHLPFRYLYAQALGAGEFLLWTPAYHSGFFLHGAGEAGMAHPLHLALYGLLPLGPAFNLEIIASYVALFFSTGLFWRQVVGATPGAWFGAMVFTFGGFNLFNLMHVNHIGTLAHAPWILLAAHVLATTNSQRTVALAFVGLAAATGLQFLAGNLQYVWLTMLAVAYLLLCVALTGAPRGRVVLALAGLAAGGLIGGVQLLPTLDFLRDSTRSAWTADQALTFSLSPWNVIQLWAPFAFEFRVHAPPAEEFLVHEFIVYNGAFCTIALAWAAMRYRSLTHRGLLVALLAFAVLNLALAFGRFGPLYPVIAELPGVRNLRAPARHLVWVQFCLSGVAGLVLDDMITFGRRRQQLEWRQLWPLAGLAGLAILTTLVGSTLSGSEWAVARGLRLSGLLRAAPAVVIVLTAIGVVVAAARGKAWAVAGIIILTAFDVGLWGYSYALRWGPIQSLAQLRAAAPAPPEAKPGDLVPSVTGGKDGLVVLRGLRLTEGYTGLSSARSLDPRDPIVERLAGMTWTGDGDHWSPVSQSMARARMVAEVRPSASPMADLKAVDPARVALVDRPVSVSGQPGAARMLKDRPGHLTVATDATGPQVLVVTERFHRGWRIQIDDRPAAAIRVYGDFLGCVVPAGHHQVNFQFWPDSIKQGLRLTLLGVGITSAGAIWLATTRRSV